MDTALHLAGLTELWELTCQLPGTTPPHGLVIYKVRAITKDLAEDMLYALHPSWTVLTVRHEDTSR